MRYLRMLSNSLLAGILASSYLLLLILQLNPSLPLNPIRLEPLITRVGLFYVFHLTAVSYVLLVIRQLLAREVFSPAWVSVSVLAWLGALASIAGMSLMWMNLYVFSRVLEPTTARTIVYGAVMLSASALLFVVIMMGRRWWPGLRIAWAAALCLLAVASVAGPAAIRGRGTALGLAARPIDASVDVTPAERTGRVTIIALDAGSLDLITSATIEGRLPNFGRVLDAGAVMHLASVRPTSPQAVWTAVATGKQPQKNGVRLPAIYRMDDRSEAIQLLPDYCFASALLRFGFLREEAHSARALQTRTLWSILSTHGVSVGVVGWPLTEPAPAVRGYVISDSFHRIAQTSSGVVDSPAVYPSELQEVASRAMESAMVDESSLVPTGSTGRLENRQESAGRTDRIYERIAAEMTRIRPVQVSVVRFQSLDPIGHYFLRYAMPSEFGDVNDDDRQRWGPVLERHYGIVDEAIGQAIAALGPDDLLLVVSGYGMEPLGFGKRMLERLIGDADVSGTHENAPDGFLLAYGTPVSRARLATRASLVDLVPTVLYFLGLPVGRDMDGSARTELFQSAFTEDRPITFIPTYDR